MRFHHFLRLFSSLLLLYLAPITACVGLLWASTVFYSAFDSSYTSDWDERNWRKLPPAPRKLTDLLWAGSGFIYAQDETGQRLQCKIASHLDQSCWLITESVPQIDLEAACVIYDDFADWDATDVPPNVIVVDRAQIRFCEPGFAGDWSVSTIRYVLTQTGEVWEMGVDGADVVTTPNLDRVERIITLTGGGVGLCIPLCLGALLWLPELLILFYRALQHSQTAGQK